MPLPVWNPHNRPLNGWAPAHIGVLTLLRVPYGASMALTPIAAPLTLPVSAAMAAPPPPATAIVVTPSEKSTDADASHTGTRQSPEQLLALKALPPAEEGSNPYLEKALNELNQQMRAWDTNLRFEVDPDIHRIVVSIMDAESGDVLRTIPTEAVIHAAKMLVKMQGLAIETTA